MSCILLQEYFTQKMLCVIVSAEEKEVKIEVEVVNLIKLDRFVT